MIRPAPQKPGKPGCIIGDNGTEFTSRAILKWADKKDLSWRHIDPGKPQKKVIIESFNGSLRDQFLNEKIFDSRDDARRTLALWLDDYNTVRLRSSLAGQPDTAAGAPNA
ncbi:Integrase core domain-containing protein [Salipiger marinus]|uniref:Integrase core domain-containing protein n=1 Tax=Salipiger marinus TaxID=555512 RepID=A0A1G8M6T2_9RHOB|nr:Integrase core domain-containing protein [Salipiger marinus]